MRIGVLGTGMVGHAMATRLVGLGNEVKMGSRSATNPRAVAWVERCGSGASAGTFADAAAFGEMLFNATHGPASVEALRSAGAENLAGKVLVDQSNPLVFGRGGPSLAVCNTDSLAEQIQREFPSAKVVKALNHLNNSLMTDPSKLPGDHDTFVCGNVAAKRQVVALLKQMGWTRITDLGDLTGARAMEMYTMFFSRLFGTFGSPVFNIQIVRQKPPIPAVDLYKEIHKGLRHALFSVTSQAGRTNPEDGSEVAALAAETRNVVWILREHARHEDRDIQPLVEEYAAPLAPLLAHGHEESEARLTQLGAAGDALTGSGVRALYLDLASFTSAYLAHLQDEETKVMPALQAAMALDDLMGVQSRLRGAVMPDEMCRFLRYMVPGLSLEERGFMLGGMKQFAPPALFEMFRGVAESSLSKEEYRTLAARIGLA